MNTSPDEVSSLEARLTLARWHLDAAFSAQDAAMRDHLSRARQACDCVVVALPGLSATGAKHASIAAQLAALRSRLEEVEAAAT